MINGQKSFGNLNPIFVMGKGAFICFIEEWIKMCQNYSLVYAISLESTEHQKSKPGNKLEINGIKIAEMVGFAIPIIKRVKNEPFFFVCKSWSRKDFSKKWGFSGNIIFNFIIDPDSETLKENKINKNIILQTQKMILERSALLKKDFFRTNACDQKELCYF